MVLSFHSELAASGCNFLRQKIFWLGILILAEITVSQLDSRLIQSSLENCLKLKLSNRECSNEKIEGT